MIEYLPSASEFPFELTLDDFSLSSAEHDAEYFNCGNEGVEIPLYDELLDYAPSWEGMEESLFSDEYQFYVLLDYSSKEELV